MTDIFLVKKGLHSTVLQDNVFCRVIDITVKNIAYQSGKRLVKYKIGYWNNEPLLLEEPDGLIQTLLDNKVIDTFTTLVDLVDLSVQELIKSCVYDFHNVQNKCTIDHFKNALIKETWDNQFLYNFTNNKVYKLSYLEIDPLYIGRIEHESTYFSNDNVYPITLQESTVKYTVNDSTFKVIETSLKNNIPYKTNDSYFVDFLATISPTNTLNTFQLVHY